MIDRTAKLYWEGLVFRRAIVEIAGVPPGDVVIHATPAVEEAAARAIAGPCRLARVPAGVSSYANKIGQTASPALAGAERVVLCDADLVVLEPFEEALDAAVAGRLVFGETPSASCLRAIFAADGASCDWVEACAEDGGTFATDRNNLNGGLYVVDAASLSTFGAAWRAKCARLLNEPGALGGADPTYADQIGAALALTALGIRAQHLAARWNASPTLGGSMPVAALHDLQKFDPALRAEDGRLRSNASPHARRLDAIIADANDAQLGRAFAHYRCFRFALYAGAFDRAAALIDAVRNEPIAFPALARDMGIHLEAFRRMARQDTGRAE